MKSCCKYDWSEWKKKTTAITIPLPSATQSSASRFYDTYKLIKVNSVKKLPSPYSINPMLGLKADEKKDHMYSYADVSVWLLSFLSSDKYSVTIKKLPKPQHPALSTSQCKLPDLYIHHKFKNNILLQIEVNSSQSSNGRSSIRKLIFGIIDQLITLRNLDSDINSCSGFYFPRPHEMGHVVKVTVTWSDKELKFIACPNYMHHDKEDWLNIRESIQSTLNEEELKLRKVMGRNPSHLQLPLTKSYICSTFGPAAKQIGSGTSVVILNHETEKVYKYPLGLSENLMLYNLMSKKIPRCALPIKKSAGNESFFEYDMYARPVSRETAREYLSTFIESVHEAIEHFHLNGYAHLDVRLENICYDRDGNAILIDFDRAKPVAEQASFMIEEYGESVMYECYVETWTACELDWHQFGLMIYYIQSTNDYNYHTTDPTVADPTGVHPFVAKLILEGKKILRENSQLIFPAGVYDDKLLAVNQ